MSRKFSGVLLRQVRTGLSVRPEALAVAVGRSVESIRGYEAERIDPPASVVAALAEALGVSPGDLFDAIDEAA